MPRSTRPPLQLVDHPNLSEKHEKDHILGNDGTHWELYKFKGGDVWVPLLISGADGKFGTKDDPVWFPPGTPGLPAAWQGKPPQGTRILEIPVARAARPSAVYTPFAPGKMVFTQKMLERCPIGFPGKPWATLAVHPGKGKEPKEEGIGSPFHDMLHPLNANHKWIWVWIGYGEYIGIPIPIPNPFYAFTGPTHIELQKQQIDNFFSRAFTQCMKLGFPHDKGADFKELDSNYVKDLLQNRPQYARLLPAMSDDIGNIVHLGMDVKLHDEGFVERTINQYLANAARHKWSPEQTLQCWRACGYDVNPLRLVGLVPGLSPMPPQGPVPGTGKPPGWQGAWPGDWQGLKEQILQEIPINPNCIEIPAIPELRRDVNIAYLKVDRAEIRKGGSATISWSTDNAETVYLTPGVFPVAPAGEMIVSPAVTTHYVLTANGDHGDRDTETIAVVVVSNVAQKPPGWQGQWPIAWPAQQPSWWPGNWQWPPSQPQTANYAWPQAPRGTPFPQARPPYWPQGWAWPPPQQAPLPPVQQGPPGWQGPYPVPWPQAKPPWWLQSWPWPPTQPPSIAFPFPQPPYAWPFPQPRPPYWPQPWPWPPPSQGPPLVGPQGPRGLPGQPGRIGPRGPQGPKGQKGDCECEIPKMPDPKARILGVVVYDFRNIILHRNYL